MSATRRELSQVRRSLEQVFAQERIRDEAASPQAQRMAEAKRAVNGLLNLRPGCQFELHEASDAWVPGKVLVCTEPFDTADERARSVSCGTHMRFMKYDSEGDAVVVFGHRLVHVYREDFDKLASA